MYVHVVTLLYVESTVYVCTSKLVLLDSIADCAIAYVLNYACMNVYYLFVYIVIHVEKRSDEFISREDCKP